MKSCGSFHIARNVKIVQQSSLGETHGQKMYSDDLKTRLAQYSNGKIVSGWGMFGAII